MPEAARWDRLRNETFLVVGFTELTGLSVATLLEANRIRYKISDYKSLDQLRPLLTGLTIAKQDVFTGPQNVSQLEGITRIILSPGVPRSIPLIAEAVRRRVPIFSDIDFLYDFIKHKKIIAVTGTDGKTTTTTLIAEILGTSTRVVKAGNIGVPVCSRYDEILRCDTVVLEVSSFMLEDLKCFRPNISMVLNIAEDHVDRYDSLDEYARTKLNVIRHCTSEDVFILNLDDIIVSSLAPGRVQTRTVSRFNRGADYCLADGNLFFRDHRMPYAECLPKGTHHVENILMAVATACEAGIAPEQVAMAVRGFRGLPHRFEFLGSCRGVQIYDDSKATTVHAVDGALQSFDGNVVLIMGGKDKFLDFTPLRRHAARIKYLVCYGEAGERIRGSLDLTNSEDVVRFDDAVLLAVSRCREGDVLILSPGCTSFDQFPNYDVRGAVFKEIVRERLGELNSCRTEDREMSMSGPSRTGRL